MEKKETYTISEVSEMLGLPVSTIRYYDRMGLLPNVERNKNDYREFTDSDISGLKMIQCFKSTGMSIKNIRRWIALSKEGDYTLEERYTILLEQKNFIEKQMKDLEEEMKMIDHKIDYYHNKLDKKG